MYCMSVSALISSPSEIVLSVLIVYYESKSTGRSIHNHCAKKAHQRKSGDSIDPLLIDLIRLEMTSHDRDRRVDDAGDRYYQRLNEHLAHYALLALGCIAAAILVWSTLYRLNCYIRRLLGPSDEHQRHFVPMRKWLALVIQKTYSLCATL